MFLWPQFTYQTLHIPLCIKSLRLLTTLLMTSFSSTDPLPNLVILPTIFQLGAPTNGARKDIHFNDRSVIRGAFEGFSGGGLEKLNTWYKMLLYTNLLSS